MSINTYIVSRTRACLLVAGLLLGAFASPPIAEAQTHRIDYLVGLLQKSTHFRVRVQAALSLGQARPTPKVINALSVALRDTHPAVRASAISSLERLGDSSVLSALKTLRRDRNPGVRKAAIRAFRILKKASIVPKGPGAKPRYYVGVAVPSSQGLLAASELRGLQTFLRQSVAEVAGVKLAPPSEGNRQAKQVLRKKRLDGYFLDSSVVSLERRAEGALRAEVSLIISTYPGRDMRATLSGAATAQGGGDQKENRRIAIHAAYTGALRRLPQVFEAASRR